MTHKGISNKSDDTATIPINQRRVKEKINLKTFNSRKYSMMDDTAINNSSKLQMSKSYFQITPLLPLLLITGSEITDIFPLKKEVSFPQFQNVILVRVSNLGNITKS